MNKYEFMSKLENLLKVSNEDRQSILDEYESYFQEAMNDGLSESEVVSMLETPEEIATTANEELGVKPDGEKIKDFVDAQAEAVKEGYEKFMDFDKVNEFSTKVTESVNTAVESLNETFKNLNIGETISKAMEGVTASFVKVKDFGGDKVDDLAMKFDNSRVETFESDEDLKLIINDTNNKIMDVEIISNGDKLVVKSLPTSLKTSIEYNSGLLTIEVPESNIRYSEKKRMRIIVPLDTKNLNVESDCPLSISDLEIEDLSVIGKDSPLKLADLQLNNLNLTAGHGPVVVKEVDGNDVSIRIGNGPLVVKEIDVENIDIVSEDGPLVAKEIDSTKLTIEAGHGQATVKEVDSEEAKIKLGSGLISIKEINVEKLDVELGSGPKTIKNVESTEFSINCSGGLLTMKDIEAEVLKGDITGTMKTLKNITVENSELNK